MTERGTVTEGRGDGEVVGGVNDTATRVENLVGGVWVSAIDKMTCLFF